MGPVIIPTVHDLEQQCTTLNTMSVRSLSALRSAHDHAAFSAIKKP